MTTKKISAPETGTYLALATYEAGGVSVLFTECENPSEGVRLLVWYESAALYHNGKLVAETDGDVVYITTPSGIKWFEAEQTKQIINAIEHVGGNQ